MPGITLTSHNGMALVTVLLITSLASIIAVSMISSQHLEIRRAENIIHNDQSRLYLIGAEEWAKQILASDNANVDSPDDSWARPLGPEEVEGGKITARIIDLQGRFNLNSLVINGQVNQENYQRFRRLLSLLDLPVSVADVVVDWIDNNQEVRPQGAEDDYYLAGNQPYHTANTEMVSASELLNLKDIDYPVYEKLKPYVTALPGSTDINLNTASELIIASLSDSISVYHAQQIIMNRTHKSYQSIDDFIQRNSPGAKSINKSGLSVASHYFLVISTLSNDGALYHLQSVIKREEQQVTTVMRIQGEV